MITLRSGRPGAGMSLFVSQTLLTLSLQQHGDLSLTEWSDAADGRHHALSMARLQRVTRIRSNIQKSGARFRCRADAQHAGSGAKRR